MKISHLDAAYIQNWKLKKSILGARLFNWELNSCEADGYLLTGRMKTSIKVLLLPVAIVVSFFYCLYDGGLKEFPDAVHDAFGDAIPCREYPNEYEDSRYARMKEIYEKRA
jgi:hypothetical protein